MTQSSCGAEFNRCAIPFCVVGCWPGVLSCGVVFPGGPLLRVEPVFGETQEEQLSGIRWNVVACRVAVIVCCRTKFRSSEEERCR